MRVSHCTLIVLAAAVWCTGGGILFYKGCTLLLHAADDGEKFAWRIMAILAGIIIGLVKSRFLFSKSCEKNIQRIKSLKDPRVWQFYRPIFFLFLALMILTGVLLNCLAKNSYPMAIAVGALDISLAVALLTSSIVFFKNQ